MKHENQETKSNEEPGVGRLIARIHRGIYNFVGSRLKNCDLDVGQFFFLRYILLHEGITQDQIARGILLDKATVSKGLKRLSDLGYVEKKTNPDDKREYRIFATDKAKAFLPEIESIYKEVHNKLYRRFNEQQVQQLQSLLETVYENFEPEKPEK
jgi:DNA-binding MarR family transcriptional regulator